MNLICCTRILSALLVGLVVSSISARVTHAGQYLVADRLLGRVLRYSESGQFLGTLIDGTSTFGYGPASLTSPGGGLSGIVLSPDQTRIYLSDRNQSKVVVYANHGNSATQLFEFTSSGQSTIQSPASMLFSHDGSKLYIANLGLTPLPASDKVAQVTLDGVSAGPDLAGGPVKGRSGLAFDPQGRLLAGHFNLLEPGGGGVLRFNTVSNQFENFIGPMDALTGAAGLLVHGNDLYVSAIGGSLGKFDATTGAIQAGFGTGGFLPITADFNVPGNMILSADATTFLIGVPTAADGEGDIQRFTSTGALSLFADNETAINFPSLAGINGPPTAVAAGFSEATGLVYSTIIPEPASVCLIAIGLVAVGMIGRRNR